MVHKQIKHFARPDFVLLYFMRFLHLPNAPKCMNAFLLNIRLIDDNKVKQLITQFFIIAASISETGAVSFMPAYRISVCFGITSEKHL